MRNREEEQKRQRGRKVKKESEQDKMTRKEMLLALSSIASALSVTKSVKGRKEDRDDGIVRKAN